MIYLIAWISWFIGPFRLASIILWLIALRSANSHLIDTSKKPIDQYHETKRLRLFKIRDLTGQRIIAYLIVPWIAIGIIVSLMFTFSMDEFIVALFTQLVSFIVTVISCLVWKHLRRIEIRNATALALAYWIVAQSATFLVVYMIVPHIASYEALVMQLQNILPGADNTFVIILPSAVAIISAIVAAIIATTSFDQRTSWILLALAVPSVVLSFAWSRYIDQGIFTVDLGFTMNLFGLVAAIENARLVSYINSPWFARDEVIATFKHNLRLMPIIAIALITVGLLTLLLSDWITTVDGIYAFLARWTIVATISGIVYLLAKFMQTPHQALKWTMFVWMSASLILGIPAYEAKLNDPSIDAYDNFTRDYFRFLDLHQMIALICLFVLCIALVLNRWRLALPCGIGTLYPSLFIQLIGPGQYQAPKMPIVLTYPTWLDLSMMTIVFFFCVYYVFGPAGILKDNAPSDPTGELKAGAIRELSAESESV